MTTCVLTFDIEEWFQVENLRPLFPPERWDGVPRRAAATTRRLLDVLDGYGIRATFFVLGWLADREPGLVREIADAGHEVACHGYGHRLAGELSPEEFRHDVTRARELLAALAGREVLGYRAPSFALTRERLSVLADAGFRYDSSHHPFSLHDRYGRLDHPEVECAPGVYRMEPRLLELPLSMERLGPLAVPVSGGGYLRLYPGALFRALVRRVVRRGGPYVMYLHAWEIDPDQPRVTGLSATRRFRHYNNLARTLPRLHRLVSMLQARGVAFMTAAEYLHTAAPATTTPG